MQWSKQLPTAEGYYWFRDDDGEEVASVYKEGGLLRVRLCLDYHVSYLVTNLRDAEWAGPIDRPTNQIENGETSKQPRVNDSCENGTIQTSD